MNKISSSTYWDLIYPSVTVHSSASATITVAGKSFTSDVSGNTIHSMPWGIFSISDSVSGQSFECTIGRDTSDVYVMPKGALYWYGNECTDATGGWNFHLWRESINTTYSGEKKSNYIYTTTSSSASLPILYGCHTKNQINIKPYDILHSDFDVTYSGEASNFCIGSINRIDYGDHNSFSNMFSELTGKSKLIFENEHTEYIGYKHGYNNSISTVTLRAVWIE